MTDPQRTPIPVAQDSNSPDIAWRPSPAYIERSRLRRFMDRHGIASVAELMNRSVADIAWFWDAVVQDLDLEWFQPYTQVVDLSRGIEWPHWFPGGRYNYVHDAVDKHAERLRPQATALIWEGEDGAVITLTYAELAAQVNRAANALKALGLGKGDRVGVFMPMVPETVIATLAISKIGAIYIPIFSGYAGAAVATRLGDCGARLLITADGFYRRGGQVPMKETADEAAAASPTVEHLLVVRRLGRAVPWTAGRDVWWDELVPQQSAECATEQTDAEDPYMIIYTSGTTGRPKGAVHTHCGFPIKGAQDMAHGFDLQPGDVLFWITDIGWMMGPWAISGSLMLGATLMIYEGVPGYPQPDRLWALVERHRVTHLGISPTAVRSLMGQGDHWVKAHDLSRLLFFGSTGEPWNPDPWRWLFDVVGEGKRPILNYSGGTEISGGILCCNPLLPLKPCSFNAPVPGMAADVVDAEGHPVRGEVGELVIRQPWVGMTRGFWQDPDRYIETYWSRIPGIWVHGDWALIDEDGFWYILGRSDDTIKVAGKRVGPAEVESAAVSHPAVAEAAAIGVPHALKGEVVVVFVMLRPNYAPSEPLRGEIEAAIVHQLGKSLKPEAVRFVQDIPRTRNAKILRRLVRRAYLDEPLGDTSSLENPAALEAVQGAQ
ncbi:MAG TPA: AMP-binding protein [Chloroflexia bacterium]|nr:AMP-binding protein [Chloroflexia bacterium]